MDLISVSKAIEDRIGLLATARKMLQDNATAKATAISNYDKALATTLIKLKNGVELEVEGIMIQSPPASIMEKIAKGYCWKERLAMETSEAVYKANVSALDSLSSELNGYQSIFRYLEEV